jgi:hypothetical protein
LGLEQLPRGKLSRRPGIIRDDEAGIGLEGIAPQAGRIEVDRLVHIGRFAIDAFARIPFVQHVTEGIAARERPAHLIDRQALLAEGGVEIEDADVDPLDAVALEDREGVIGVLASIAILSSISSPASGPPRRPDHSSSFISR